MDEASRTLRLWRAHELLGGGVVFAWACFHLWEQWPAFLGVTAFVDRTSTTSHGVLALLAELLLGLAPPLIWIGLEIYLRRLGPEPTELAGAMAEDAELAERLGRLGRWSSRIFFASLLYHVGFLWVPKLLEGSEPAMTYRRLALLGTWPHTIGHAILLSAFTVHAAYALPRLFVVMGWAASPEVRRGARLSGLIMALGLAVLYVELTGWHAAGVGTLWPLP